MLEDYKIVNKTAFELESDKITGEIFNNSEYGKFYKLGQIHMINALYHEKVIDKEVAEIFVNAFKKDEPKFEKLVDTILNKERN